MICFLGVGCASAWSHSACWRPWDRTFCLPMQTYLCGDVIDLTIRKHLFQLVYSADRLLRWGQTQPIDIGILR